MYPTQFWQSNIFEGEQGYEGLKVEKMVITFLVGITNYLFQNLASGLLWSHTPAKLRVQVQP
jgi:hypothetical protein